MRVPSSSVLLVALLLAAPVAQGAPRTQPCGEGTVRVDLSAAPSNEGLEACISPGVSTTLTFSGAELSEEGVTVEGRERFTLVDVGRTLLRLIPSARVAPGEELELTVHFKKGAVPRSITFRLLVHAARADSLVEVYHPGSDVEACQRSLEQRTHELQRCMEENARLQARRETPEGLLQAIASGVVDKAGVLTEDLPIKTLAVQPMDTLQPMRARGYLATQRVVLELQVRNRDDARTWTVEGASLKGTGGTELRVLSVWPRAVLPPGAEGTIWVEAETLEMDLPGPYILELWAEGRQRVLTLGRVRFP